MTTRSRADPDFDWNDYRATVDEWLLSREATADIKENDENQRFARATVVLFGWLPLAIVMFWLSLILTKGIAFVNDDPIPRYGLTAWGAPGKDLLVSVEGEPTNMSLTIIVPLGIRLITLQQIPKGPDCTWAQGQKVSPRDGIKSTTVFDYDQKIMGDQVDILVPTSAETFSVTEQYGSFTQVLTLVCKVAWEPKQESFSKYELTIDNALDFDHGDLVSYLNEESGYYSEDILLSAYKLNESKLLTFAGRRTQQDDERYLISGSSAVVEWNSENGAEERDALFVVIGAFIAIGAAILIEGLRPHVELAIESNYANASGKPD